MELHGLGLIEKVFPVMIGTQNDDLRYARYQGPHPKYNPPYFPDVAVQAVEEKLRWHMDAQGLGVPVEPFSSLNPLPPSHPRRSLAHAL